MNEVYNDRFVPEFFSVSALKIISLVRSYIYETRRWKAKLAEEYMWTWNMKSFSNKTLNFFFRKFYGSHFWILLKVNELCESCHENLVKTFKSMSFEHWRTMYLWICYFTLVISQRYIKYTLSIHWYIHTYR